MDQTEATNKFDGPNTTVIESGKSRKVRSEKQQEAFKKAQIARAKQLEEWKKKPKKERMSFTKMASGMMDKINELHSQLSDLKQNKSLESPSQNNSETQEREEMPRTHQYKRQEPPREPSSNEHSEEEIEYQYEETPTGEDDDEGQMEIEEPKPKKAPKKKVVVVQKKTVPKAPVMPPVIEKKKKRKHRSPSPSSSDSDGQSNNESDDDHMHSYDAGSGLAWSQSAAQRAGMSHPHRVSAVPQHRLTNRGPAQKLQYTQADRNVDQFSRWLSMA